MENLNTLEIAITKSPFKLFQPFTEDEKQNFFGRDDETDLLYQLIHESNVVLLYGESGTGKTSLVQCGLLNEIKHFNWTSITIRRIDDINHSLILSLKKFVEQEYMKDDACGLLQEVFLNNFQPILLIFDQFEELFVLGDEVERKEFLKTIKAVMQLKIPWKMIFIIREDYLASLKELEEGIPNYLKNVEQTEKQANAFEEGIPNLFKKELRIPVMSKAMCRKVVIESCNHFKINLTPVAKAIGDLDTPNIIVEAASSPNKQVHLPYLQVFLDQLWKEANKKNSTTVTIDPELVSVVEKKGNVLKVFLDESIQGQEILTRIDAWKLLKLFVPDKGTTRKKIKLDEYTSLPGSSLYEIVDYFIRCNILSGCADLNYELAHESLVPVIQNVKLTELRTRLVKPTIHGNPYKGLRSFDAADCDRFYGRTDAKTAVYEKTISNNLVVIVGNSGTGKSSLIKAGLFPKLEEDGYEVLKIIKMGERPVESLDETVSYIQNHPTGKKFILLLDQYEELITRINQKEIRQAVYNKIYEMITAQNNGNGGFSLKIIITVRADFEPQFSITQPLAAAWKQGKYIIPPFSREEIMEIIEEPAYQAGLEFSPPSLVEAIADEVYGSQATGLLPLMSFILSELYNSYKDNNRNDNLLLEEDYKALGGVIGGLQNRADQIFRQFENEYPENYILYQDVMRNIILRMVYLSTGELAGQRVLAEDLEFKNDQINIVRAEVMDKLTDSCLILTAQDNQARVYYEPAHDVFIKTWGQIWDWIGKVGKDKLYLRTRLSDAVNDYYNRNQDSKRLWATDPWLDELMKVVEKDQNWLNKKEDEFVLHSLKKREEAEANIRKEQEEKIRLKEEIIYQQKLVIEKEQKANAEVLKANALKEKAIEDTLNLKQNKIDQLKRFRLFIVLAFLVVSLLGYVAFMNGINANKNYLKEIAANRENKILTDSLGTQNSLLSTAIGKEQAATRSAKEASNSARLAAEQQIAQRKKAESLNVKLHTQVKVTQQAQSLAAKRLDTLLVEQEKTKLINDTLTAANFSLDSTVKELTAQRIQNTSQLLSVAKIYESKDMVKAFRITELAWNRDPDNSEALESYTRLANTQTYFYTRQFDGDFSAYSPDGEYILTSSSAQQTIKLRRNKSFEVIDSLPTKPGLISLSFSSDGRSIMMAYKDEIDISRTNRLRDRSNFKIKERNIVDARFSNQNDDRVIIVTDGRIHIYKYYFNNELPIKLFSLSGSEVPMAAAFFSANNKRIISVTLTGSVITWDATTGRRLKQYKDGVEGSFISPVGNYFITASSKSADLYSDSEKRTSLSYLTRKYGTLNSVTFSKDGNKAVMIFSTISIRQQQQQQQQNKSDNYLRKTSVVLVNLADPEINPVELNNFIGSDNISLLIGGSPKFAIDGNFLFYAEGDGPIRLLRLDTNKQEVLTGHKNWANVISVFDNGSSILTSSTDSETKVWNYGTARDPAIKRLLPNLTDEDLRRLGLGN